MADDKKKVEGSNINTTERIIALLVGLFVVAALANALLNSLETFNLGTPTSIWGGIMSYFFTEIWPTWKVVAGLVSAAALIAVTYNLKKTHDIDVEERKIYNPTPVPHAEAGQVIEKPKNEKWEKVMVYANSSHSSDWKQAIMEADVMLDELLRTLGYRGDSVGEMLKSVDKSDFLTLNDAWEAHKIRNNVAHSGGNFQLDERETRRVIALFENVFREFQLI